MIKKEIFDHDLQRLADFARVLSHPARLEILRFLAETKSCISGDISDKIPLSRTTVSQHLKELRDLGLIHGEIEGQKVNYCLCSSSIHQYLELFQRFFGPISSVDVECNATKTQ